tara:strand:+ start:13268 stop:14650 length:1383 start_codon:yes stop_codon:yes gene_type:complete
MKLTFLFLLIANISFCQSPYGDWYATLKSADLPLVFHIKKEGKNNQISVDSPKQNAFDMPGEIFIAKGNSIKVEMPKLGVTYEGTYYSDSISGLFKQGPIVETLTFYQKKIEPKKANRPQNPKAPYFYTREEVKFENLQDSFSLAGTLTLPKNKKDLPAIVLVSGSGPQNRDEEMMSHRPFWVIADYLTNLGYAVLRYDDRGTFDSEGDFSAATTLDFARDASAAVYYLKKRPEVDSTKIIVIGHSEGGLIANILGASIPSLSGIVSLAGTSIRGDSILRIQTKLIAESTGGNGVQQELRHSYNNAIWDAAIASANIKEFEKELSSISKDFIKKFRKKNLIKKSEKTEVINAVKNTWLNPWMYEFIRYSPSNDIPNITCDVLVLIGSRDIQVTSKENIRGYNDLLPNNGKLHIVKELKGLNHLFQRCETCTISEYEQLEETFSTIALEEIRSFLKRIWAE